MAEGISRKGLLVKWDAAWKVPSILLLMMSMAFTGKPEYFVLSPFIAGIFTVVAGVNYARLFKVLKAPLALAVAMGCFMVFFSGGEPYSAGFQAVSGDGALQAAGMVSRVFSVVTMGFVMVTTTPAAGLPASMRRLRVPDIMIDMAMLTGRYVMVIGEDYRRMEVARRLRGGRRILSPGAFLEVIPQVAAGLLVRSFERSENVFRVMKLRGYGASNERVRETVGPRRVDLMLSGVAILLSAALVVPELL